MSRTRKDLPRKVMLRDAAAYPEAHRYTHHRHDLFGKDYSYDKFDYDEVEKKWVRRDEQTYQGRFADYCTVDIVQSDLPGGILAPCHTSIMWDNRDASPYEKKKRNAKKRKVRGTSRVRLHAAAREHEADGETLSDTTIPTRRRELHSW